MSFKEIRIKQEYRSLSDDIVQEFYLPLLKRAVLYKRAVGYFSSSALIEVSKGLTGLIRNGGKILLVASPHLSEEDIEAMNKGFEIRNKVIENALLNSLTTPKDYYEEERLNLLAHLIADGVLDIKIALIKQNNSFGMFHEKMGLIYDNDNNLIAFSGSMNETYTAFSHNYEAIDVFCSWTGDRERVLSKQATFEAMWNNYETNIEIIDFPEVAKEIFKKYKKTEIDLTIDEKQFTNRKGFTIKETQPVLVNTPRIPAHIRLHDYQIEAIDNWEKSNYVGIFDMATGTGKTFTGLGAVVRLHERLEKNLAVFIVCPYQHLVEQWVEDILQFEIEPIIGYSASTQKDWRKRLKDSVLAFNLGIESHFCFISTNATFASKFVQEHVNKISGNALLLVDEAHNFGARLLSKTLNPKIPYRLALSATLERHGDEEGTAKLFEYFGEKNIEYSLKRAIQEDKLTPYYYYPVVVHLNPEELDQYKEITKKINKCIKFSKDGKIKMTKAAEILFIQRARIVAGAIEKMEKLKEIIEDYKHDKHILVYCGATTIRDSDYKEGIIAEYEERQIDRVTKLLGIELNMGVSQFTSRESAQERDVLKKEFAEGDTIQALIAIRCLDEGVNIPDIKTAFILASSTNPKEYVQRRGRVLRKAPGKTKAVIYDFVTLPRPIDDVYYLDDSDLDMDMSLIKRELERIKDFASIAENASVADKLIDELEDAYRLNVLRGREYEF